MAFLAAIPAIMGSMMAEAGGVLAAGAAGAAEAAPAAFSGIAGAAPAAAAAPAAVGGGLTAGEMAALGLTAAGAASTMLTPTPKIGQPETTTPTVAPEEDSDTILKARQRAMVSQQQRQGRASTMLSSNSDSLGG